jgi:hypothetical protein
MPRQRQRCESRYGSTGDRWEHQASSYCCGYHMRSRPDYRGRAWNEVEPNSALTRSGATRTHPGTKPARPSALRGRTPPPYFSSTPSSEDSDVLSVRFLGTLLGRWRAPTRPVHSPAADRCGPQPCGAPRGHVARVHGHIRFKQLRWRRRVRFVAIAHCMHGARCRGRGHRGAQPRLR